MAVTDPYPIRDELEAASDALFAVVDTIDQWRSSLAYNFDHAEPAQVLDAELLGWLTYFGGSFQKLARSLDRDIDAIRVHADNLFHETVCDPMWKAREATMPKGGKDA